MPLPIFLPVMPRLSRWLPAVILWVATIVLPARGETTPVEPLPYFELRIYDVTTNKLAGVLERFRETVDPVRRRHGICAVGYWTAASPTGEKYVYLMKAANAADLATREKAFSADSDFQSGFAASNRKHGKNIEKITTIPLITDNTAQFSFAPSDPARTFELREYSVPAAKLAAFRARWQDHAIPIYARHGLQSIGWWQAAKPDPTGSETFICLLAGASPAAIQKAIADFHADPEWRAITEQTEKDGPLRNGVAVLTLHPTEFSALK